jgi:spoIIIJ-associated protein
MSEERTTLEIIAPTIEEAITQGLADLGVSKEGVDIEILDEGSKGLLGIGNRQARVQLIVKSDAGMSAVSELPAAPAPKFQGNDDIENTVSIAKTVVEELLEKMGVHASVEARALAPAEDDTFPNLYVNITGDDLSYLIGRHAETLNALQFITRMIVGKEVGHASNIVVDVEGYRERRERSLRQMANKMASQAIQSGSAQSLEPMTPAERRIIHIELRDNDEVTTSSSGDEPRRKVTISPK